MMTMTENKGHWQSAGYTWDSDDEAPTCHHCNRKAGKVTLFETDVSGIFCCMSPKCLRQYAEDNWSEIYFEEER